MLDGFQSDGPAFVRPVQILPTKEEITAELIEREKQDQVKREETRLLLAELFPEKFSVDIPRIFV